MTAEDGRNQSHFPLHQHVECRDFHNLQNSSDICRFITETDDCQIEEGFVNYVALFYCSFANMETLGMILVFALLLVFFVGLGVTADDYFCPSLTVIAKTLRLSDNIAGVTFLAFGNGAPDVFSAISAIASSKNADASLAVGALVGAGIFVTTVVAGSISIVRPFESMQRPLLRDIIFYIVAVYMVFTVFYYGHVKLWHALGFIMLYVLYVIVVTAGRYLRNKLKRSQQRRELAAPSINSTSINTQQDDEDGMTSAEHHVTSANIAESPSVAVVDGTRSHGRALTLDEERRPLLGNSEAHNYHHPCFQLLLGICPVDLDVWSSKGWIWKCFEIFKAPIILLLNITVPVVHLEDEDDSWNKLLYAMQCITAPLTCLFLINHQGALMHLAPQAHIEVWMVVLLAGIILAVIVLVTTKHNVRPKYIWVFAYIGFVVAVVWIYSLANEIVNILQAFGIAFNISDAILGLTLLAWGNSIGDFVANTVMARQGSPRVGISACFGGPLFNLLLGLGIPFTIQVIRHGGSVEVKLTFLQVILMAALATSLLSSLIIVPLCKFKFTRYYGIYLILLYVTFLLVAILVEVNVIKVNL